MASGGGDAGSSRYDAGLLVCLLVGWLDARLVHGLLMVKKRIAGRKAGRLWGL